MRPSLRARQRKKPKMQVERALSLQEVLQSLRMVLEMQPETLDGAIDLLDEAIYIDQQRNSQCYGLRT